MVKSRSTEKNDGASFGRGADRRLATAALDASRAARTASEGSARAAMLEGLRTAAAAVAAALAATRGTGHAAQQPGATRRKKTTTALLVACGGLEQAIRSVVPAERRAPQSLEPGAAAESAADESAA
jgi:hypothetical protein